MQFDRRGSRLAITAAGLALALVVGCSSAPSASQLIGASGGTVSGPGGAQVTVPAGALSVDTAIAIAEDGTGAPELPAGYHSAGPVFALTPHGTAFTTPVQLKLPFDTAAVDAGATVALLKTANGAAGPWEEVAGATAADGFVTAEIASFSFARVVTSDGPTQMVELPWQNVRTTSIAVGLDGTVSIAGTMPPGSGLDPTFTPPTDSGAVNFVAKLDSSLAVRWVRMLPGYGGTSYHMLLEADRSHSPMYRPSVGVGADGVVCLAHTTSYALVDGGVGAPLPDQRADARVDCFSGDGLPLAPWPVQVSLRTLNAVADIAVGVDDVVTVLMNTAAAGSYSDGAGTIQDYRTAWMQISSTGKILTAPGDLDIGVARRSTAFGMCFGTDKMVVRLNAATGPNPVSGLDAILDGMVVALRTDGAASAGFPYVSSELSVGALGLACSGTGMIYDGAFAWNGLTGALLTGYPNDLLAPVDGTVPGRGLLPVVSGAEDVYVTQDLAVEGQPNGGGALINSFRGTTGAVRAGFPRRVASPNWDSARINAMALEPGDARVYSVGRLWNSAGGLTSAVFVARTRTH